MAKRTDAQGTPSISMHDLWDCFCARSAVSGDLPRLLKLGKGRWALGTFADVLSRALVEEEIIQRKRPDRRISFPIDEMTRLKITERVDGILPIPVPVPGDLRQLGKELLKESHRLGLRDPEPDDYAIIRDEIAVCYLAFLHRRKIRLNYQLEMELVASCPGTTGVSQSPKPATGDSLMLMGNLPLGGRIVVFFSSLDVKDWSEMSPGEIEHNDELSAARARDGRLLLVGDEESER